MLRTTFSLLLALLVTACATTAPESLSTVKVPVKPVTDVAFVFEDKRTSEQKTTRTVNTSYNTEIYLGDNGVEPVADELVKGWLHLKSTSLSGKRVSLTEFEIRIVDPQPAVNADQLATSSAAVPGGAAVAPLAGLLIYGIEKMRREIITRVVIRITVDDREVEAIAYKNFRSQVNEADLASTVQLALDELTTKL